MSQLAGSGKSGKRKVATGICLTRLRAHGARLHPMSFFTPVRPLLKGWLLSFAGWGGVALILGVQLVSRGDTWSDAFRNGARDWLPWMIFTPLIFRFVDRFPLDRRHWKIDVPVHLIACVAVLSLCLGWKLVIEPDSAGTRLRPPGMEPGGQGSPGLDLLRFVSFELPVYLLLVSMAHTLLYYRQSQERAAGLARARLNGLRMQLQPHFLFNTLNTIAGLVHEEPDKADAMLTALGDLLRIALETSAELELPLKRELDFVERYLGLMHARFEERLHFEIHAEPEVRAARVPPLLLQPLVENAIRHGIGSLPRGGTVTVRAWREGSSLHLSVADDGVGARKSLPFKEGFGLGNTRERLRELYGDLATLEFRGDNGFVVEVILPFHLAA
jgi:hypothetical protein